MFSRAVGREGRCRQMLLVHVGSTHSVLATLGLAPLTARVLSPSTVLRLQATLQGAGRELHALPRPKPLRSRFSGPPQRRRPGWACILCLPRLSSSGSQELDKRTLPRCGESYPLVVPASVSAHVHWSRAPCVSSGELVSSCDPPSGC